MSTKLTKPERLIAFLSGNLLPKEENKFREELESDQELGAAKDHLELLHERTQQAEAFQEMRKREMVELSKLSKEEQLAFALKKLGKEPVLVPEKKVVAKHRSLYRVLYRLASAAAVAALVLVAWFNTRPPSIEQLIADNFVTYEKEGKMAGLSDQRFVNLRDRYLEIISTRGSYTRSIKLGDETAIIKSRAIIDSLSILNASPEVNLLKAHASFSCGDYEQSALLFSSVANSESGDKYTALWNSIMAYIADGGHSVLVEQKLAEITKDSGNPYRDKAVQLLKDLSRVKK